MVKVEQIRLLETKVQNAINYIERLRTENKSLRKSLETYEDRISDLESLVSEFRNGQEEIETGIANALKQLDQLEDEVVDQPQAPKVVAHGASTKEDAPVSQPQTKNPARGPATRNENEKAEVESEKRRGPGQHPESATPFAGRLEEPRKAAAKNDPAEAEGDAQDSSQAADSELDIF